MATNQMAREAVCPKCGRARMLSGRHARRNPVCRLCRVPPRREPPTDSDRRYWLKLFSDSDIIAIAFFVFGEEGDVNVCHAWREHLLPESEDLESVLNDLLP